MQIKDHTIEVLGARARYHEAGEGPAVILLHGAGPGASGLSNFRKNVEALSAKHRVIVPDFPGFGESENKLPAGGLFAVMGGFVRALMDQLGIERAAFVGNSMGGGVSLEMALRAPERVEKLVLMGTGGSIPIFTPMLTEGLTRMVGFYAGDGPSMEKLRRVIDLLVYDPSAITEELMQERYKAATRKDVVDNYVLKAHPWEELWRENIGAITQETLLIWGREDRVVPLDAAFLLMKAMPKARLHVFPQCGHWAQWEKAGEFNALVLNFLALDA